MKTVKQSVSLEYITPNAAELIEHAGRTCYKSENKITPTSAHEFVEMVKHRGHHSVIEHPYASFRVITNRGVSHEFVRHRLFSYSQESTRYCNYSKKKFGKEITVIEPPGLDEFTYAIWKQSVEKAEQSYFELLDGWGDKYPGVPPQIARSVLPICLKTEFVATANFREWRHFIRLRTAPAAHPEMREVATWIRDTLIEHCPVVFSDLLDLRTTDQKVDEFKKELLALRTQEHNAVPDETIGDGSVATIDTVLKIMEEIFRRK